MILPRCAQQETEQPQIKDGSDVHQEDPSVQSQEDAKADIVFTDDQWPDLPNSLHYNKLQGNKAKLYYLAKFE